MKEAKKDTEYRRPNILKRMAGLLIGPEIITIKPTEAPLRAPSVDPDAFERLRNLSIDTPVEDVLRDLNIVSGTAPTELT